MSSTVSGPLASLGVVDLSTTLTGAQFSQLFADFGAEVIQVEPPGGSPLRSQPAFPLWGRGKKSVELDLRNADHVEVARNLAAGADVVVETWRPGVAERLGLGYEVLAADNPRLVYASVTGFGRTGPYANLKAYEAVVLAKLGALDTLSSLTTRPGPSFASTPYCSFSASLTALCGTLAALYEREQSGVGQRVDATLVQGLGAHDTWNWMVRLVAARYPDAFTAVPRAEATAATRAGADRGSVALITVRPSRRLRSRCCSLHRNPP